MSEDSANNDDTLEGEELGSKIVYQKFRPLPGDCHLVVVQSEGANSALELASLADKDFWNKTHLFYIPDGSSKSYTEQLKALNPRFYHEWPTISAATCHLDVLMSGLKACTRIYIAGTSGAIGKIMISVANAGFDTYKTICDRRGSKARRIQCVHCKGITEDVTSQPATCSHCGLILFVRGHYSRRIGAYQGVCINAEDPNDIPETEEIFV